MEVLLKGIYSKKTGSSFNTAIGGRLYLHEAPQQATFPYCVYYLITNTPDDTFTESGEEFTIQFNIFSNKNSASEVNTLYGYLKTLYEHTTLSITGYNHTHTWRNFATLIRDEENNIWQYSVEYRIRIDKTR